MLIESSPGDLRDVTRQREWPLAGLSGRSVSAGLALPQLDTAQIARLYKENPWLNAGVRAIAWGLSRSMLKVYTRDDDGSRVNVRWTESAPGRPSSARELDRKINSPTRRIGPQRRMRATATDYILRGNALWVTSEPEGIYHVPWRQVKPIEGTNEPIIGYEIAGSLGKRFIAPEDVIHFSTADDPDSPIGLSPCVSLRHTLALHETIAKHLLAFFDNNARPSGNLKIPTTGVTKESIDLVRAAVEELYESPENAGKIIVTTGDFQPISGNAEQSQLIELAHNSREEIAAVLRIPGSVLGFVSANTAVGDLRSQYYRDTVGAWAPAMEDDIMAQYVLQNPNLRDTFVQFDLQSELEPDIAAQATVLQQLERVATLNERRAKINLPRLDFPEADSVPRAPGAGFVGNDAAEPPTPSVPVRDDAPVEASPEPGIASRREASDTPSE